VSRPFAAALARRLVRPQPFEARLPQQAVLRPFAERDLGYQARPDPVDVLAVGRLAFVQGRFRLFQPLQPPRRSSRVSLV
jgi:hypothetical protein